MVPPHLCCRYEEEINRRTAAENEFVLLKKVRSRGAGGAVSPSDGTQAFTTGLGLWWRQEIRSLGKSQNHTRAVQLVFTCCVHVCLYVSSCECVCMCMPLQVCISVCVCMCMCV